MPTGLRQTQVFESRSQVKRLVTILTDRALKMYREQTEVCSTYGECLFTATT